VSRRDIVDDDGIRGDPCIVSDAHGPHNDATRMQSDPVTDRRFESVILAHRHALVDPAVGTYDGLPSHHDTLTMKDLESRADCRAFVDIDARPDPSKGEEQSGQELLLISRGAMREPVRGLTDEGGAVDE
jgi:hypothetical protein